MKILAHLFPFEDPDTFFLCAAFLTLPRVSR
jgi:hypothetical protein